MDVKQPPDALINSLDPTDFVLIARLSDKTAQAIAEGDITSMEACAGAWVISEDSKNRIAVVLGVWRDQILAAFRVTGGDRASRPSASGERTVGTWRLRLVEDPLAAQLHGQPSPIERTRRNPVGLIQARDCAPFQHLFAGTSPQQSGRVQLAGYILDVTADGQALLTIPPAGRLTVQHTVVGGGDQAQ